MGLMQVGVSAEMILVLLVTGATAGLLAGLLGIGGGMFLVPCLVYLLDRQGIADDLAIKTAIATAMATILFTSLSSVWAHQKRGAICWNVVRGLVPGIIAGGLLAGAGAFNAIKGQTLGIFFALFVGYSAWRMYRGRSIDKPSRQNVHGFAGLAVVGSAIGFMSGLVGAGGGFVSVPYMTRCGVAIHKAIATSAALGFPIALANVIGYTVAGWKLPAAAPASWGYFYLPALGLIVVCSVFTAPLGARLAHRLDVAALKKAFALLLALLAVYMLLKSVA